MKIKNIIIFCIILSSLVFATQIACDDETDITDIPCTAITPPIPGDFSCNNYTYNVTFVSSGELAQSGNLTAVGDGTWKFDFNQGKGKYNIFLCENSTTYATITVDEFDDTSNLEEWGLLLVIFFIWTIFIAGLYLEKRQYENAYLIKFICAFLMIFLGVYLTNNGLMDLDKNIVNIVAYLHFGVGGYFVVKEGWEQYKTM